MSMTTGSLILLWQFYFYNLCLFKIIHYTNKNHNKCFINDGFIVSSSAKRVAELLRYVADTGRERMQKNHRATNARLMEFT